MDKEFKPPPAHVEGSRFAETNSEDDTSVNHADGKTSAHAIQNPLRVSVSKLIMSCY
jgi:hypothetical protein